MQFKPLANTGILLPEICLGTMTFGEQNTQADAFSTIGLCFGARIKLLGHRRNVSGAAQTRNPRFN